MRFKSLDKLLELLDRQLQLHLGKVSVLYDVHPKLTKLNSIQDILQSDSTYFIAGSSTEPFRNIHYNINSVDKSLKPSSTQVLKTNKVSVPVVQVKMAKQLDYE